MNNKFQSRWIYLLGLVLISISCAEDFLPEELEVFDEDTRFNQTVFRPILGRNNLMNNVFNPANSSRPFDMEIINLRRVDGSPATELTENHPVKVWEKPYLGNETSLEEIEDKRTIENRPLFSIRKHSGDFVMWNGANSSFVKTEPDSGYVFDVEVANAGGNKFFEDMRLIPQRERPYEPSNYDPLLGIAEDEYVRPLSVTNVESDESRFDLSLEDIEIYFNEVEDLSNDFNTLTFKFLDKDYNPIDPDNFNLTDWENLVHGFDMEFTEEYVRYQVAYPIPLVETQTQYTNSTGEQARTVFSYDRINAGGFREVAEIVFEFSIYQSGHWEIIVVFPEENPNFEND